MRLSKNAERLCFIYENVFFTAFQMPLSNKKSYSSDFYIIGVFPQTGDLSGPKQKCLNDCN